MREVTIDFGRGRRVNAQYGKLFFGAAGERDRSDVDDIVSIVMVEHLPVAHAATGLPALQPPPPVRPAADEIVMQAPGSKHHVGRLDDSWLAPGDDVAIQIAARHVGLHEVRIDHPARDLPAKQHLHMPVWIEIPAGARSNASMTNRSLLSSIPPEPKIIQLIANASPSSARSIRSAIVASGDG